MRKLVVSAFCFQTVSAEVESRRKVVRFSSILLLFAVAISSQISNAQTRPRRVRDDNSSEVPVSSSTPPPSRPPVLGGVDSSGLIQDTKRLPASQEGPEEVGTGDVVQINTTLVTIPVSVMDHDGKYIPNLRKEDFRLWDDDLEQQVAYFASTEQPFTVVLMIDTSGSTHFKLDQIQHAAITFVNQLQPNDRVMVVSFDDKIRVLVDPPTSDRGLLRNAIMKTHTGGGTRLYDAVDQVMNQYLVHVQGRKAIVLFTDGVDTTSRRAHYEDNLHDAEELDALIYPVQFDTYEDMNTILWPGSGRGQSSRSIVLGNILGGRILIGRGVGWPGGGGWPGGSLPGSSPEDYRRADQYLHALADKTGARAYNADRDLSEAFAQVAEELRRQYSLGYYPKPAGQPGERHQIKVRTDQPDVVVRTRASYIYQSKSKVAAMDSQGPSPVLH